MSDPFEGLFDSGEVLERVAVNLTTQARRGDLEPVRCRDAEIARVVDILLRQSKNNPALIGKAGVGKTAIVEGLAQRVAAGDVPPALKDVRVVALDHVALLAGTTFRGQYEERIRKLVRELSADPDLILFVDELHNLIGQGTALGAAMDAANMLKPALVRGDIRIIGATTGGEYDKWIRGDPALERLIRERRKVDAMIRRGLTHERPPQEPAEDLMADIFPMLERIGAEIEKMLGGGGQGRSEEVRGGRSVDVQPSSTSSNLPKPPPTLSDRREALDRLLRQELENQGIVVGGQEDARVVGVAVGKGIEWQA